MSDDVRRGLTCDHCGEKWSAHIQSDWELHGLRDENDIPNCVARLRAEVAEAKAGHLITTEQISKAWNILETYRHSLEFRDSLIWQAIGSVLSIFGIIPCPKCGGTKKLNVDAGHDFIDVTCDCPNNGWVMASEEE